MRAPLAILLALAFSRSWAGLGEAAASTQIDQMRVAASVRRESVAGLYRVQSITNADGSVVREYVGPDGLVFAVAWSTLYKPDFRRLFAAYHPRYAALAAREMANRGGIHRQFRAADGDLRIASSGWLNKFFGRAWLESKIPLGVTLDEIR